MPRAVVGTFVVGQLRVGQNDVQLAKPKLRLVGKQFSIQVYSDADVVQYPTRPKLRLQGRAFSLTVNQQLSPGKAVLRLRGRAYEVVVPVGPHYDQKPVLRLRGRAFTLTTSQTLTFDKAVLRLLARPLLRVGQPGLSPTVPDTIILTPSPVEVAILTPTVEEDGTALLTPTPVRSI